MSVRENFNPAGVQVYRQGQAARFMAGLRGLFNRELLSYLGPGFLVTLGFIDPGNWATNMAGGSQFQYDLLWVITASTLMLILLQQMAARLGAVTGLSLASNIRTRFSPVVVGFLGITITLACVATDLAEYLGGALGLELLFGVPRWLSAVITGVVVNVLVYREQYRRLEHILLGFLQAVAVIYLVELIIVRPDWVAVWPHAFMVHVDEKSLFLAMGMLGAVVMPHNIYLHSNVIRAREWGTGPDRRRLLRFASIDTVMAMLTGWLINSSMIIVAATVFYPHGIVVQTISQAAESLRPLVGNVAGVLFAAALLACGWGSSLTSSLSKAGIIMGYLGRPEDERGLWLRGILILSGAVVVAVIALAPDPFALLIWSQVVLSIQLPFTMVPLIILTRDPAVMGEFASGKWEFALAVVTATVVVGLNVLLLYWSIV